MGRQVLYSPQGRERWGNLRMPPAALMDKRTCLLRVGTSTVSYYLSASCTALYQEVHQSLWQRRSQLHKRLITIAYFESTKATASTHRMQATYSYGLRTSTQYYYPVISYSYLSRQKDGPLARRPGKGSRDEVYWLEALLFHSSLACTPLPPPPPPSLPAHPLLTPRTQLTADGDVDRSTSPLSASILPSVRPPARLLAARTPQRQSLSLGTPVQARQHGRRRPPRRSSTLPIGGPSPHHL